MLFIDPGKYRCHEIRGDGEIVTEDTANADYAEALSRESHLTAATENAFQHYASVNDIPFEPGRPFIWDAGAYRHLPAEVIDAANIELTAVISPELADQTWVIRRAARAIKAHANAWPEETGGRDTVARLLALIEMTEKGEPVDRADFEALLQPERERLIGNLKITIAALCDLVYA